MDQKVGALQVGEVGTCTYMFIHTTYGYNPRNARPRGRNEAAVERLKS